MERRPRVLVVEDRPSVLKLMATVLERRYEVTTAPDGAAALALLNPGSFDVVLTDIRMQGASGFDVVRAVQARSPATRVVMITAYANVPDAVAAMRVGAFDYVAKPLDADEIALVVARAVDAEGEPRARASEAVACGDRRTDDVAAHDVSIGFHRAVAEARERISRAYLVSVMRRHRGNVTQAALQAGMTRESLHRLLKKHGVRSEDYRDGATEAPPATDGDWIASGSRR